MTRTPGKKAWRQLRRLTLWAAPQSFLAGRFRLGLGADPDHHEIGLAGERLVERALRRRGWRILGRRLETIHGEVDIVAVEGEVLVCVEVKTGRKGPRFRPGLRLNARKLARLKLGAKRLALEAGLNASRVDLFEVLLPLPDRGVSRPAPRIIQHRGLRGPLR